jgi:hypothetical protein
MSGKKFKIKACINDGEVKCAASAEICKTCEFRDAFNCQDATLNIKGTASEGIEIHESK